MSVTFTGPQRATFDVHGSALPDVASALTSMPEAGTTEWHPTYALAADGTSAATVNVPMKITMPRWVEYGAASAADKAEWDRFYAALETHEQGHVAIVRQQLAGVDQQLAGLVMAVEQILTLGTFAAVLVLPSIRSARRRALPARREQLA